MEKPFLRPLANAFSLLSALSVFSGADHNLLADETLSGTQLVQDIEYAYSGNSAHRLDLYLPPEDRPHPLIIWIHGGAWRSGSKANVPLKNLLKEGWAIASVEYRLSPEAPFPAQMHDIKAAVRFLQAKSRKYGLDSSRFVLAGASAGGHLAALAGLSNGASDLEGSLGEYNDESSRVAAVISFYGASNFETILGQSTEHGLSVRIPALKLFIGGMPEEVPERARYASPLFHVDPEDPPTLLIHGKQDPQMPFAQSIELRDALGEAGVPNELVAIPQGKHGGAEFYDAETLGELLSFLNRYVN